MVKLTYADGFGFIGRFRLGSQFGISGSAGAGQNAGLPTSAVIGDPDIFRAAKLVIDQRGRFSIVGRRAFLKGRDAAIEQAR